MKVANKCCNQCLMSENKIVSDKRRKTLIKEITDRQGFFVCHKATIEGKEICCRGFYDTFGYKSQNVRIAQRLNMIEFVEVE